MSQYQVTAQIPVATDATEHLVPVAKDQRFPPPYSHLSTYKLEVVPLMVAGQRTIEPVSVQQQRGMTS